MRLFVSLEIPPPVRTACDAVLKRLRAAAGGVRILPAEALHLTLAFLGEVDEARVGPIRDALAAVAAGHRPIRLCIAGAGAFPNARRPRVLWLGVEDPDGGIATLAGAVQKALAPLGFEPEARAFRPHLTVARIADGRLPASLRAALTAAEAAHVAAAEAATLALMQSRLDPAGARYAAVATWPLRGP